MRWIRGVADYLRSRKRKGIATHKFAALSQHDNRAFRVGVGRLPYHSAITFAEVADTLCLLGSISSQLKLATECCLE